MSSLWLHGVKQSCAAAREHDCADCGGEQSRGSVRSCDIHGESIVVTWDMCAWRSMTLMSRVSVRGPWCRDTMRLTRSIVTKEATTVVALVRHLLRHLHRPRCLPTTGHLQQCAEKLSCEGRDLSERVTFSSQSTDGQEERFEMNMKWSTQCRFFYVAYNLTDCTSPICDSRLVSCFSTS